MNCPAGRKEIVAHHIGAFRGYLVGHIARRFNGYWQFRGLSKEQKHTFHLRITQRQELSS